MPFTISHAAAVLPFSRLLARWQLLSAVVIGAMAPDFGLFFPWRVYRFETHTVTGLLGFCLPVGLIAYWIFQYLVKTPVLELLPPGAYARWRPFCAPAAIWSLLQWVLATLGVLAGAVTHLVWDAFTHEGARGVRLIPWLEDPIVEIGNHHVGGIRLLQDGSSLIGLAIVLGIICYGLRRGRPQPPLARTLRPGERHAWILAYAIGAVALSAAWLLWAHSRNTYPHSAKGLANAIAVSALRGLAATMLGVSVALSWRLRALRRAPGPTPT